MEKKKKREFTGKHFAIAYFGLLMLVLTFIGVMMWLGYSMINMRTEYMLVGALIVSALVAGLVLLLRRLTHKAARIVIGALGAVVILAVAVVLLTVFTVMLNLNTPQYYATLKSESGKSVVVMREWGDDPDLVELRAQQRWAASEAEIEQEYTAEDLGYSYFAAPKVLGMFYDAARISEGEMEIGVSSQAKLVYAWEGETLRLYIKNAEEGDQGETLLKLEEK